MTNTFYYHYIRVIALWELFFGAKYEIVQLSRDYRDNFAMCKMIQIIR